MRAQGGVKKLLARMASPQVNTVDFTSTAGPTTPSKQAIVWLTIVSVLVVATAIVVTILLCRCTCNRKKKERKYHANGHSHHSSLEVTDGRNDHAAWNRSFTPVGPRTIDGADADGFALTPLARAAERPEPEHLDVLQPRPIVIDEVDPLTPMSAPARMARGSSRYHSGVNAALKRVIQIGKVY
jgi:hypothetical protein